MNSKKGGYSIHNKLKLIRGGADYFTCINEIADNARYSLHLQTYIFDEDETGKEVAAALIRAAKRGVQVYVLLDGYASHSLSDGFVAGLRNAGAYFAYFEPVFKSKNFYIGRRLHHKVIVADFSVCMVAGINISNRYNDIGGQKAWLDWAIHAEGEVAEQLNDVCIKLWNRSTLRNKCLATDKTSKLPLPQDECPVRIRRNDWIYRKTEITDSYREIFPLAKVDVTIMTSYFWPPQKLLRSMARAAARGIKVRLVLTAKSDIMIAKYAERYLYAYLFRNNIEVYEYQSNILHGKMAECDGQWVTMGSYNVNNISAYASVELNLDIQDTAIAREVKDKLNAIIANESTRIDPAAFTATRNLLKKFLYFLAYRIVHMIFYMFMFNFVRKKERDKG